MRGSPLIRALAALLLMLSLAFPLHRLLRAEATTAAPVAKVEAPKALHLQVDFTTAPKSFRVLSLGKELWREGAPQLEVSREVTLAFPPDGVDLQFECNWPEEVRAAARVRLTAPDGAEHEKVIWGQGATTEVLTFP